MMEGLRQRIWTRLRQTLWFQPALASALAGFWVVLAIIGGPLLSGMDDLPIPDKDTIVELLKMGGGSLLTIATVTLSVLMVVLNAAAGQASPRALPGLMSDRMTHRALAAFIGGFVYAVTGVVVLGLLFLSTVLIVSNTIRLTVFARRKEIEIMQMVGAAEWFIRWPFILEGVLQGLLGSVLAAVVVGGSYAMVIPKLTETISFLPMVEAQNMLPTLLPILILNGAFVGALGSLVSVNKFLKV